MRKILVLLCFYAWSCQTVFAEKVLIDLTVEIVDDRPNRPGKEKAPMRMPHVFIEDHTLSFPKFHPEYVINIVQGDEVVYTAVIPSDVPTFELPSVINGECTIQLIRGRFCFWGYILL